MRFQNIKLNTMEVEFMRKKIIFILAISLLTASMSACTNKASVELGQKTSSVQVGESISEVQSETVSEETEPIDVTESDTSDEIEQYKNADIEFIKELIDSSDYAYAYYQIDQFISYYGTDNTISKLQNELKQKVLSEVDVNVNGYLANNDYLSASEYINGIKFDFKDYTELQELYEQTINSYVDSVIHEAKVAIASGNYNRAKDIIAVGEANLVDNVRLATAKGEFTAYEPVYLIDLDIFNGSVVPPSIDINRNMRDIKLGETADSHSYVKDNTGTDHVFSYFIGLNPTSSKGECFAEYLINKKYNTFDGICAVSDENTISLYPAYFEVYGDGELLYTSPWMEKGVMPETFSIDVSNVDLLRLEFHNDGGITSSNKAARIFDGVFTKTLDLNE